MAKFVEYDVAVGLTISELKSSVAGFLRAGYEVSGSLVIKDSVTNPMSAPPEKPKQVFYQAMTKTTN